MKEFRVRWQECPYVSHRIRLLFIAAETEEDARAIAKDHIERTHGITWFTIYEAKEAKPVPAGEVLGDG